MDNTTVVAIAGILATLIGSLAGPYIVARFTRRKELVSAVKTQRTAPYLKFTTAMEKLQRNFDLLVASKTPKTSDHWLEELELQRARIDIVGSPQARVWAYRCKLALDAIDGAVRSADFQGASYFREKLHEARASFVRNVRFELEVAAFDGHRFRPRGSDQLTTGDQMLPKMQPTIDDHLRWLSTPSGDGEMPGIRTIQQIRDVIERNAPLPPNDASAD